MPLVKPTCIRDLKARVSIVDVVGRVATLKRAGNRFKGLCPFHQEKTPSFHVNPDRGLFKCFGCGKGGDLIQFVQETEGLEFTEAIETLGKRFGVPIEFEEGRGPTAAERSLRQELFDLHEVAAEHFHRAFKERGDIGDFMRTYWVERRKFPLEVADDFKIGAADETGSALAALVLKKGFTEDAIRQSGLFFVRDGAALTLGAIRPRFRGRLMVPIRDHQSRVVAFTARQTDRTPADDPAREAKYVNSPETPIFTKGHLLFNLDRARTAAKDDAPFVLVEGQLDAIRAWHTGVKTAVAGQGTALTETQLSLLHRYSARLECLFDSDAAGQKAALRLLPLALKEGLEVRFLALAGAAKLDPDDLFLERGLAAYDDLRTHALSAMAFACHSLLPAPESATPEVKTRAAEQLFEMLAGIASQMARGEFIIDAARHLRVAPAAMQRDFESFLTTRQRRTPAGVASAGGSETNTGGPNAARPAGTGGATGSPGSAFANVAGAPGAAPAVGATGARSAINIAPEQHLLLLCLHFETFAPTLAQALPHDWIDPEQPAGALLNRFLAEFEQGTWPGRDHLDSLLESEAERQLVAQLLFDAPEIDDPGKVASEGLRQLRTRALEPRLREIELALSSPPADSNFDANSLIRRRQEIQRQLREPIRLHVAV